MIRKLLLLGLLLAAGQGLIAAASTEQADESLQPSSQQPSQSTSTSSGDSPDSSPASAPNDSSNSQPTASPSNPASPAATASPAIDSPAIRDPLLSSLILPLPPLLLPDLLLPPYSFPSFDSERLDQELQLYSRYLRIYGAPDVLIVGSSRSLQGIDPSALQQGLEEQGHSTVTVFNLGINGATAQVVDVLLRQILTEEQLPKLIVWGDGLRAFNDGRVDLTYEAIIASDGYRRLATGDRPIPPRSFYRESTALRTTANKAQSKATPAPPTSALTSATATASPQRMIAPDLDMFGFQAVAQEFDPVTYYQRYPDVPGNFDADYVPFALGGAQTQAVVSVARFAQAQGVPLVVVNLPLTQHYMDAPRLTYEQQFRQHMQQLAQRERFAFVDLVQHPNLIHDHYFADPSHINRAGARAVALHLATLTQIPWQTIESEVESSDSSES